MDVYFGLKSLKMWAKSTRWKLLQGRTVQASQSRSSWVFRLQGPSWHAGHKTFGTHDSAAQLPDGLSRAHVGLMKEINLTSMFGLTPSGRGGCASCTMRNSADIGCRSK